MTHRENFLRKHNLSLDSNLSLQQISRLSKVPLAILKEVEKRGYGAYNNNLSSVRLIDGTKNYNTAEVGKAGRMSPQQWARARVYSFVDKGTTYYTTDSDLAKKI